MENKKIINDVRLYTLELTKLMMWCLLNIEDKTIYLDRIKAITNLSKRESEMWNQFINADKTFKITPWKISNIVGTEKIIDKETVDRILDRKEKEILDSCINRYEQMYKRLEITDNLLDYVYKIRTGQGVSSSELIDSITKTVDTMKQREYVDIIDKLEKMYYEDTDNTRISTCIDEIDKTSGMLRKGTVNTIMGYTGSYKTMYCTNIAYEAIKSNLNVCYISLEISKKDMLYNFLSRYSNEEKCGGKISHTAMKFKTLNENEEKRLFKQIIPEFQKDYSEHLIIIDESDFGCDDTTSFDSLFIKIENIFEQRTGKGIDLIVIDHLNLLKFTDNGAMNDYAKVNHWMSYFRKNCLNLAKKNKQTCILVAVQCSRSGYEQARKNDGQYELTGAAEGNEIERSSENVIAIYSDSDLKANNTFKIQLIKGRNCDTMPEPILAYVNPKYYLITNYVKKTEEVQKKYIDKNIFDKIIDKSENSSTKTLIIDENTKKELKKVGVSFDKE